VHGLLEREHIDHWLFGSWAVDFHAARVTRTHDDVDLAVWKDDVERIAALFEQTGWVHAPEPDEDGGTGYERGLVRLELTFLVPEPAGGAAVALRAGVAPFAGGAFGDDVLELDGTRCRVLDRAGLVGMKSSGRGDPDEQAKDASDLSVLN
jgi:hypothetical protein